MMMNDDVRTTTATTPTTIVALFSTIVLQITSCGSNEESIAQDTSIFHPMSAEHHHVVPANYT